MTNNAKQIASSIEQHVATRLRAARLEARLSQAQVAQLLGITFQQIQKYERGTNRIPIGRLAMLCHYTGKNISWFFAGLPGVAAIETSGSTIDIGSQLLAVPHGRELMAAALHMTAHGRATLATLADAMGPGPAA